MEELDKNSLTIHKNTSPTPSYPFNEKVIDLIRLATAPGISSSNSIYKKIQRRCYYDKSLQLKKSHRLKDFALNSFDDHIFLASQQNKGVLTKQALETYAKTTFLLDERVNSFMDYIKGRLGYLSYLGLLNDIGEGNQYYEEKVTWLKDEVEKDRKVRMRVNYQYQVNETFYRHLVDYRKHKRKLIKEQFEFGRFDAYIYKLLQETNGFLDFEKVKQEKLTQASENSKKIQFQVQLMAELGYLKELDNNSFKLSESFATKLQNNKIFLNAAEKKIVQFIQHNSIYTSDKYKLLLETEAESYTAILKARIDKLVTLGFLEKCNSLYSFTKIGNNRLMAYYSEFYEFTQFDRNILNHHKDGILDTDDILAQLNAQYGELSAAKSFERQQERLFIMTCAGLVKCESPGIYTITDKGLYILDEENALYTMEKRALLKQAFKYTSDVDDFYNLIKSKGGTINPEVEIENIMATVDAKDGIREYQAYNALMRGYEALFQKGSSQKDELLKSVNLGYIIENEDGTLSLTLKGKLLVNALNMKEGNLREKALSNKRFRLLNDIDKNFNRLDPKIYLKVQKCINDKSLRNTVKLLRYSPEKLSLIEYLQKNADGSYTVTPNFDKASSNYRQISSDNINYNPNNKKSNKKEKALEDFIPGTGYINLLKAANGDILDFSAIEKRILKYNASIRERELSIKRGMINKLLHNKYLEFIQSTDDVPATGTMQSSSIKQYRLTQKAIDIIQSVKLQSITTQGALSNATSHEASNYNDKTNQSLQIKITQFDLDNIIAPSLQGFLLKDFLIDNIKKESIKKRIQTLIKSGLMKDIENGWQLSDKLIERSTIRHEINLTRKKTHSPKLDLAHLTMEEKRLLTDLKDFLNLTGSQILKYIYSGNEPVFKTDLKHLISKGILRKDSVLDIYVLTKKGSKLASDLTGDHNIFGSKLDSRRQEIKHDILVYTAYKDLEKKLLNEGKVITSIKTDRLLRSIDMKANSKMSAEYPDLKIEYEDKTTGEKGFLNIEVDTGYSNKDIEKKLKIPHLRWYTDSKKQMEKVLRIARYLEVTIIHEQYWKNH